MNSLLRVVESVKHFGKDRYLDGLLDARNAAEGVLHRQKAGSESYVVADEICRLISVLMGVK